MKLAAIETKYTNCYKEESSGTSTSSNRGSHGCKIENFCETRNCNEAKEYNLDDETQDAFQGGDSPHETRADGNGGGVKLP